MNQEDLEDYSHNRKFDLKQDDQGSSLRLKFPFRPTRSLFFLKKKNFSTARRSIETSIYGYSLAVHELPTPAAGQRREDWHPPCLLSLNNFRLSGKVDNTEKSLTGYKLVACRDIDQLSVYMK